MLTFAPACGTVAPHIYSIDCQSPEDGSCPCPGYTLNAQDECVPDSTVDGGRVDATVDAGKVDDGGREDGRGDAG